MKKAALHNLGCKVNSYETQAMQELLEQNGYEIVPFSECADVYVINTCSVTNIADRKSRQMIHRARKKNENAVIVACGCYVQTAKEDVLAEGIADIIIGNDKKHELISLLEDYDKRREQSVTSNDCNARHEQSMTSNDCNARHEQSMTSNDCNARREQSVTSNDCDIKHEKSNPFHASDNGKENKITCAVEDINDANRHFEQMQLSKTGEHARAFLKVQDGCNQFCSYCIIPYARGRVRSKNREEILREVTNLAKNGYREIVLTGIHLSSYGIDTGDDLLSLILAVSRVEQVERVRLGSLEPRIITETFVEQLAKNEKFCPHFHLSLQSGCDSTLKRMNRHYTTAEYEEKCKLIRNAFTHPAITTDVIVGFPGESEEEFLKSQNFVKNMHFYEMHVFKYSRRDGTRAAVMSDQIPEEVKTKRSNALITYEKQESESFRNWYIGKEVSALMEEEISFFGTSYFTGFTKEYVKVACPCDASKIGNILHGKITKQLTPELYLMVEIS